MLCRRAGTGRAAVKPVPFARTPPVPPSLVSSRPFSSTSSRRALWGWLPDPSNEPLAGTGLGSGGPPWLFVLEVLIGLPTALWVYKCIMLVLFQRKVIYMPWLPPGSRDEPLSAVTATGEMGDMRVKEVRIVRNAGTPLNRLPLFRTLLHPPRTSSYSSSPRTLRLFPRLTLLAPAPRSYWLSTRATPTERGILADYRASLAYFHATHGPDARYVLYGHSLGGAAAVGLLKQLQQGPFACHSHSDDSATPTSEPRISGLILENPLPSIPFMVRALYPQKWLPYHWLGPLAFDRWDALGDLERLKESSGEMRSLWIRSGKDEVIPLGTEEGVKSGELAGKDGVRRMFEAWVKSTERDGGEARSEWVDVPGALHDLAYNERRWRQELRAFLDDVGRT
ncbi:hypothetical protein OF846_001007 [Rhodotorula toruloides]|nr:hypothetical protein OF846_001007 [Rhodotorula toruloides]